MLAFDPASNPLNNNEWSFPLVECFHIAAFALSIGTIAIVDLRMLGVGMLHQKPSQILKDTSVWTLAGLIIVITAGLVIFTTDPVRYYYSYAFRLKNLTLIVALIFNYTIHRKVAQSDDTGMSGKLTAVVSILLWATIVFCGLFYAFT
jgi:hypothetical protein